jgi:hypothetical protein
MQKSPTAGCVIDGEILGGSLPLVESPGVSFDIRRNPLAAQDSSLALPTVYLRPVQPLRQWDRFELALRRLALRRRSGRASNKGVRPLRVGLSTPG